MKPTLLVADGDPLLRDAYREFFGDLGYDVVTASDGLDCLHKARALRPATLIVDEGLLWGTAAGVIARLSDAPEFRPLPHVLVTGTSDPATLAAGTKVPVSRCFQKPFRTRQLLRGLRPTHRLVAT